MNNNLTQEQHLGLPRGGTWCGAPNAPGVADIRPRVPVCAACYMKAIHARGPVWRQTTIEEIQAGWEIRAHRNGRGASWGIAHHRGESAKGDWFNKAGHALTFSLYGGWVYETTAPKPLEPDPRVEKLARAMYSAYRPDPHWDELSEDRRQVWRARAVPVLTWFDAEGRRSS